MPREEMPPVLLEQVAERFRALGEPVRLALLLAVLGAGAVLIGSRRRGEVWHVAAPHQDTSAGRGDEGP